jgi:hypothetical protein
MVKLATGQRTLSKSVRLDRRTSDGRSQQRCCWGLRHHSTLLQVRKLIQTYPGLTNDGTVRSGQLLYETCATLKGAATEFDERALCVRSHWKRTSIQLDFVNRIWESLDKEHQDIQNQILQVLNGKLNNATSKLDKLIKKGSDHHSTEVNRVKYALVKK